MQLVLPSLSLILHSRPVWTIDWNCFKTILKRGAGEKQHEGKEGKGRREERKDYYNTSRGQNPSKHIDLYFKNIKIT